MKVWYMTMLPGTVKECSDFLANLYFLEKKRWNEPTKLPQQQEGKAIQVLVIMNENRWDGQWRKKWINIKEKEKENGKLTNSWVLTTKQIGYIVNCYA